MRKTITPSDIEVLIHCHFMAEQHPRHDAPAVQSAIIHFLREGIIEPDPLERRDANHRVTVYRTTEKGKAWVAAICQVPCPAPASAEDDGCRKTCHPDDPCRHCCDTGKEV